MKFAICKLNMKIESLKNPQYVTNAIRRHEHNFYYLCIGFYVAVSNNFLIKC